MQRLATALARAHTIGNGIDATHAATIPPERGRRRGHRLVREDSGTTELAQVIGANDHSFERRLHDTNEHDFRGRHDLLPPSNHPRSNHPPDQHAACEPHDDVQRMPRDKEIPAREVVWIHLLSRSGRS